MFVMITTVISLDFAILLGLNSTQVGFSTFYECPFITRGCGIARLHFLSEHYPARKEYLEQFIIPRFGGRSIILTKFSPGHMTEYLYECALCEKDSLLLVYPITYNHQKMICVKCMRQLNYERYESIDGRRPMPKDEIRRMLYCTNYEPNRNYDYQTIKITYHDNLNLDIGIRTKITNPRFKGKYKWEVEQGSGTKQYVHAWNDGKSRESLLQWEHTKLNYDKISDNIKGFISGCTFQPIDEVEFQEHDEIEKGS